MIIHIGEFIIAFVLFLSFISENLWFLAHKHKLQMKIQHNSIECWYKLSSFRAATMDGYQLINVDGFPSKFIIQIAKITPEKSMNCQFSFEFRIKI